MRKNNRPLGLVLRALCFSITILFFAGIAEDLGDPYMPFITILAFYLVLEGVPLLVMLAVTNRYCKKRGERFWISPKSDLLALVACAFPVSGLLRLGVGLLITGLPKQAFFEEGVVILLCFSIAGAALFAFSRAVKRKEQQ